MWQPSFTLSTQLSANTLLIVTQDDLAVTDTNLSYILAPTHTFELTCIPLLMLL